MPFPAASAGYSQEELFSSPIQSFSAFSVAVGAFYQALASQVFHGENLITSNTFAVCPDVRLADDRTLAEIKAASTKQGFRLRWSQVQSYRQLHDGGFRVFYGFFEHGMRDGFRRLPEKTVGAVVSALAQSTGFFVVLELPFLLDLVARMENVDRYDAVFSHHLYLSHPLLRSLCENPMSFLREQGLPLGEYVVLQTAASGLLIRGEAVGEFPVVYVMRKEQISVAPRPVDLQIVHNKMVAERVLDSEDDTDPF